MAKMNKDNIYVRDVTVSPDDSWLVNDAQDFKRTKTILAGDLLDYIMLNYGGTEQNNTITEKPLGVIDISVADAFVDALNGLDAYAVLANEIVVYTGEFSEEGKPLNTKFVYMLKTGKGNYGVDGTELTIDDVLLVNPKQPETESNTTNITNITNTVVNTFIQGDKILSGKILYTGAGLVFEATPFTYSINGGINILGFSIPYVKNYITLDDPDEGETNPRIDVFVIDTTTQSIEVIKGTPAASPQEPTVNFGTQLRVTAAYISAAGEVSVIPDEGDTPSSIVITQIYEENEGQPDEFDITVGTGVDADRTGAQKGTKCIYITDATGSTTRNFQLTTSTPIAYNFYDLLVFQMKTSAFWGNVLGNPFTSLKITITDSNDLVSSKVFGYSNLYQYGFMQDQINIWQTIAIQLSEFNSDLVDIETIAFETQNHEKLWFDDIKHQTTANGSLPIIPTKTSDLENDGATGASPFAEVRELPLNKRITATGVSGTYNLDHSLADDWKLTLTGVTTFVDLNLPTGTRTTDFTMTLTGSFTRNYPATWGTIQGDDYDGTKQNFYTIHVGNGTPGSEDITVFRTVKL